MRAVVVALAIAIDAWGHEHVAILGDLDGGGNPAGLGYTPVPLGQSYLSVPLEVSGSIPAFLSGTLYRGAPGAWPDGWWLDGLITLNAFRFESGRVLYSMRWSQDDTYNSTVAGTRPPQPLTSSLKEGAIVHFPNRSWPTGVDFRELQGQVLGSTGVSNVNSIDADTLAPVEMPFEYHDNLSGPYLAPTHAQTVDGYVLHHMVLGVTKGSGGPPAYVVTSVSPGSRTRHVVARIERPAESSPLRGLPSYQHMPLATLGHYVMLEAPCFYPDTTSWVGHVDWHGWRANLLATGHIRLVDRETGESLLYPLEQNVFAIHHINAYHDVASNSVVLDTIRSFPSILPCSVAFSGTSMDKLVNDWKITAVGLGMSTPLRFVIPLNAPGSVLKAMVISNVTGVEFPTVPSALNGKPYKYTYACWMSTAQSAYYDAIIKVDVTSGAHWSWSRQGHYPGEPIFVPRPRASTEDDGVVMTNVLDTVRNETYLLLLDGRTMLQVARAGPTPHVIPHGFHGRYFERHQEQRSSRLFV